MTAKAASRPEPQSQRMATGFVFSGLVAAIAVKVIGAWLPHGRFWGINQLAFFPKWVAFLFLLLFIALWYGISALDNRQPSPRLLARCPGSLKNLLVAVVAIALMLIAHDSTSLLGDAMLRQGELKTAGLERIKSTAAAEPLDYFLHHLTYVFLCKPLELDSVWSFRLWCVVAGLIYLWAGRNLARLLAHKGIGHAALLALLMGWGGVFMFFGYTESYTLAAAAVLVVVLQAVRYLDEQNSTAAVVLLFVLAFFLHNITIVLLPGLIYVVALEARKRKMAAAGWSLLILVAIAAWTAFSYGAKGKTGFLLPESETEPGYTLFGRAHLLDLANELLLLTPGFPALILAQRWRRKENGQATRWRSFLWPSALAGFLVAFVIDPHLGMGRDWDLLAIPLLPLHVALVAGTDWQKASNTALRALAIFSLLSTAVWVWLNTDETRSITRYKSIVELDHHRSRLGYNRLGDYYLDRARWTEAVEPLKRSLKVAPHLRAYLGLGVALAKIGQYDEAAAAFAKAHAMDPNDPSALLGLGKYFYARGQYALAHDYLWKLKQTPVGATDESVDRLLLEIEKRKAKFPLPK